MRAEKAEARVQALEEELVANTKQFAKQLAEYRVKLLDQNLSSSKMSLTRVS